MSDETTIKEPETLDPLLVQDLGLNRTKPDSYIVCAHCMHVIADPRDVFEVSGSSEHEFINPHGVVHHFRSYREALGCAIKGARNRGDTWFPGYTWRLALCGNCDSHMGWFFESTNSFYGIVTKACREVSADDL